MSNLKIIHTVLENRSHFFHLLEQNKGVIIIKFGAEWCGPCKKCHDQVVNCMQTMPAGVECYIIDVDENIDVYAFLKSKKVVAGIPAILVYYAGSIAIAPTFTVTGADPVQINRIFDKVYTDCK